MKKIPSVILLLCIATCSFGQEKTIEKTFSNVKSIQLGTASGDIIIKKSNRGNVDLTVRHSFDDESYTPTIQEHNGKLILKEEFSQGNHSGNSTWTLAVPDNASLKLNTGSGNINLENVNVELESSQGSGDIEMIRVKGEITFNTGSGDVIIRDSDGEFKINCGSGDISATGGRGDYNLNAGSGNIALKAIEGTFSANTGSGDIEAAELRLQSESKFNSGSGDASVLLAGSLDQNISVNSGSGNATLDFNGASIEGKVTMTANERNGDIVAPFEFDNEQIIRNGNSSARIEKTATLGNKNVSIHVGTGSGTATIEQ